MYSDHRLPQSNFKSRNAQLDGLRGYAAIAVVYFHSISGIDQTLIERVIYQNYTKIETGYDAWARFWLTILSGHTAVVIFFILSGVVLFQSLQNEKNTPAAVLAGKFVLRRIFRIYPAFIICLVACWTSFNLAGISMTVDQLILNLSLYNFPINGATWTLNVELFGAVLLLTCFLLYRYVGEIAIPIIGGLCAMVYLQPFQGYLIYFRLFIYAFCLGAFIATPLGRRFFARIPGSIWPVLLIVMILARHTIQETVAAFLIGLIYYNKTGILSEVLARPISVFLGRISFSIYLFNVLFLEIFNDRLRSLAFAVSHPVEFGLASGTVIVILTIPVAYLSTKYIEEPFIRLGRKLTSRRAVSNDQVFQR